MPIFEYRCSQCGRRFEALLSRREAEEAQPCPACRAGVGGKDRPEDRLLSVFAAVGGGVAAASGGADAGAAGCGAPACGAATGIG